MFIAWYYMKFLHLRRGDKLFEINFELLSKNQNPAKHFLKVSATDSLVFFSEHISRTAILAQASVITCK